MWSHFLKFSDRNRVFRVIAIEIFLLPLTEIMRIDLNIATLLIEHVVRDEHFHRI